MQKYLAPIIRGMDKLNEELGYASTYSEYFLRAAKVMKITQFVREDRCGGDEIQRVADKQQTTVVEIIRKFMKLGLLAVQIEEIPGSALLIRANGIEREIILL